MNANDPQLMHSNRPISRRLHRRFASSVIAPCAIDLKGLARPPTLIASPQSRVDKAGLFALEAAQVRICELEKELIQARLLAGSDPLTGALNRRGFAKASQREIARMRRNGSRFSLAHIDLDDFKRLNDALGHQAGDNALVHLVDVLNRSMRPSDVLCRFGGEEFVLLLPDTALEPAAVALSRFLREFSAHAVPGTDAIMTFSAGVVACSVDERIEDAIERADAAMYAAKRAGKNRVITA